MNFAPLELFKVFTRVELFDCEISPARYVDFLWLLVYSFYKTIKVDPIENYKACLEYNMSGINRDRNGPV